MTIRWNELPVGEWVALNAQLRRVVAALGASSAVTSAAVTGSLALTAVTTLVLVDTTAGNVTLTLPPVAGVAGYRIEVKKMVAANTLTLDGNASETIDGALTLAWTTQYQSYSLISTGTAWVIV